MKFFSFIFFSFLLFSCFVSAELSNQEVSDINQKYMDGNTVGFFDRYYLALKSSDFSFKEGEFSWDGFSKSTTSFSKFFFSDLFGFKKYQNFKEGHVSIIFGLLVGLLLWIFSKLRKVYLIIEKLTKRMGKYKDYDPELDLKERQSGDWIYFASGRLWKILPISIFIWICLQLPILNRIIEIASLQFLDLSLIAHAFIFAFEVGMIPQMIGDYANFRTKVKLEKKLLRMQSGAKKQEIVGEVTRKK